jgi:hypothetical protein
MTAKAAPDGYTLLWSSSTTHGMGPVLYTRLPWAKWGPVVKATGAKAD